MFLTDILIILITSVLLWLFIKLYKKGVTLLDKKELTIKKVLKKFHYAVVLNVIGISIFIFWITLISYATSLIADIFIWDVATQNQKLMSTAIFQTAANITSNVRHNFLGLAIEIFLLLCFTAYIRCIYWLDDNAECFLEGEKKFASTMFAISMFYISLFAAPILIIDICCAIIANIPMSALII
jgi:hypothetical protein